MSVITISREFGSGGRELGKRLADELGFAYFDKEIVTMIAQSSKLDENYVESMLEKHSWNIPITYGTSFSHITYFHGYSPQTAIISEQQKIIKQLASSGNCIIVGRNADVILEELNPLRLFVYADMDSKLARCRQRAKEGENLTDAQMKRYIKKIDRDRARNHLLLSDIPWGDRRGYDLMINTTGANIKAMVSAVAEYAKAHFGI